MKPLLPWKSNISLCVCVWRGGAVRGCMIGCCVGSPAQACVCSRVALLIWHAPLLHIASSLAALHFSAFSHTRHDCRKKRLLNIKCVFWLALQRLCASFLILRRIQRDIVVNVKTSPCKVPVILVGFQWNWNFLDRFSKKSNIRSHQSPSSGSRVV